VELRRAGEQGRAPRQLFLSIVEVSAVFMFMQEAGKLPSQGGRLRQIAHGPGCIEELPFELRRNRVPLQDDGSPKAPKNMLLLLRKGRVVDFNFGRMDRLVEIIRQPFLVLRKRAEAPRRVLKFADFAGSIRLSRQFAKEERHGCHRQPTVQAIAHAEGDEKGDDGQSEAPLSLPPPLLGCYVELRSEAPSDRRSDEFEAGSKAQKYRSEIGMIRDTRDDQGDKKGRNHERRNEPARSFVALPPARNGAFIRPPGDGLRELVCLDLY
jgi:hypothetical protein